MNIETASHLFAPVLLKGEHSRAAWSIHHENQLSYLRTASEFVSQHNPHLERTSPFASHVFLYGWIKAQSPRQTRGRSEEVLFLAK